MIEGQESAAVARAGIRAYARSMVERAGAGFSTRGGSMSSPLYEHPGVSVSPPGLQRWRLRWREQDDDGAARARSWTVVLRDENQAHRLAFEAGNHAVMRARLARLATLFADFIRWRTEIARKAPCAVAFAHLSPSTFDLYARRVFAAWCWATDASTPYSGHRPAPRDASRCMTARAVSAIAPEMSSWADLDRCVAMLHMGVAGASL